MLPKMSKKNRTVFEPRPPMWRAKEIIERLGGIGLMTEKLMQKGLFPPGPDTVQGWVSRNSIPGAWAPAVFALALEEKIIRNPFDAIIRDTGRLP